MGEGERKEISIRSLNTYKHMLFDIEAYCLTLPITPEIAHGTICPCKKKFNNKIRIVRMYRNYQENEQEKSLVERYTQQQQHRYVLFLNCIEFIKNPR